MQPAGEIFPAMANAKVWPPAPAQPCVKYLGAIASAADLKPARSLWVRAVGPEPEQKLVAPIDVAVSPSDQVFVADRDRRVVHCFDLGTRRHMLIGEGTLELPSAVAWGDERLFIADSRMGQVFTWSPERPQLTRFDLADLKSPAGLAYVPERQALCVADLGTRTLVLLDRDGKPIAQFPPDDAPVELGSPMHVAYHPDVGLVVSDTINGRLVRFDPDGTYRDTIGSAGDGTGNLALPKGVAADSEGHVYVVDARFENVQLFDREGRVLMDFGEEGVQPGQFSLPAGICVDGRNRIWVADTYNCRVQVFQFLGAPPASGGASDE